MSYPKESYNNSNFEGAALWVSGFDKRYIESECLKFAFISEDYGSFYPASEDEISEINIHGYNFYKITSSDGATGHTQLKNRYRIFHNGKCLEISVGLDKYREEEPLTPFTITDEEKVLNLLNQILSTFKFIN